MDKKTPKIHFNSQLLVSEMEKRGIKVKILKNSSTIIAEYKGHKEFIDDIDLGIMPASLRFTLDNKWSTKQLLKSLKFNVAEGEIFKLDELGKAKKYAEKHLPVVIKPIKGAHGYGVRPSIDTIAEFEREFINLKRFLNPPIDVIVEEQFDGADFRLSVTRDGFFAATYRTFPKVIGDGNHTIEELIVFENYKRMHPRNSSLCEIWMGDGEVDRYLNKKHININYVPKKNEKIYLRSNANVCTGGESIDVTDLVHPFYKKLALEILTKIPGLPYCGIDLITKDISEYSKNTKYIICEINPSPGISLHTHPAIGKARRFDRALVDLIFPETARPLNGLIQRAEVISKKFKSLAELANHFSKKYPKNWFYKPVSIEVEITQLCNLKCDGCGMIDDIKKGFDNFKTENILDVLKQCSKLGIYTYSLTGGEPFLKTDKLCEIIKKSPLDLFKIQTNGSVFINEKITKSILEKLKKAGFVSKNKYLKPAINCSAGMQTKFGTKPKNLAILTKVFFETFKDKARLAINILPYEKFDYDHVSKAIDKEYQKLTGESFPFDKVRMNEMHFEYTPALAKKHLVDTKKTTIREKIENLDDDFVCFNFSTAVIDTPMPRIFVKADGTLYACPCFGHSDNPGNIHKSSVYDLLDKINKNKLFQTIKESGLKTLFKTASQKDKDIGNIKIPISLSICKTCKALRNPQWIKKQKF